MRFRAHTRIFSFTIIGILVAVVLTSLPAPHRVMEDLAAHVGGVTVTASARTNYREGEVICQIARGVGVSEVARRYQLQVKRSRRNNQHLLAIGGQRTVEQVVAALSQDPRVAWAEPNFLVEPPEVEQGSAANVDQRSAAFIDGTSPASYFGQYATSLIQTEAAQALATGAGVTVAVIDTGVDTSHPVFTNVAPGFDFVDNDADPSEVSGGSGYGHGTYVAGVIALVAPGATIMPLRAFDPQGIGDTWAIASAINYAASHGADVINMSFGMWDSSLEIQSALDSATSLGIVLVAAAGNDDVSSPRFPAWDPAVLAVAATDQYDLKASFSNYGSHVDVSAPGVSIYSAYPGGGWAWWDGTSFATPFVSGEAALLLSVGLDTSRITSTAVPIVGNGLGSGRINCLAAVTP